MSQTTTHDPVLNREIDTSKLGPIRVEPTEDQARVARAQEVLEDYLVPGQLGYDRALRAMLKFEEQERNRAANPPA